jgi:hypothetical protein
MDHCLSNLDQIKVFCPREDEHIFGFVVTEDILSSLMADAGETQVPTKPERVSVVVHAINEVELWLEPIMDERQDKRERKISDSSKLGRREILTTIRQDTTPLWQHNDKRWACRPVHTTSQA